MKKLIYLVGLSLFCFQGLCQAQDKWHFVDPGGNGWWTAYTMHPTSGDLYMSSDMRLSLFRTTNHAQSWEPIANPITGTSFYIAGDPQNENLIYMNQEGVVPSQTGIWQSTNKGDSWSLLINTDLFGISKGQSAVVDPFNGQIIFWTDRYNGVQKSDDGGYTWSVFSNGLPLDQLKQKRSFNALQINYSTDVEQKKIYYPTNRGLFISSTKTPKWETPNDLPTNLCLQVTLCDDNVIYAAFPKSGLFKSTDGGIKWEKLKNILDGNLPLRVIAARDESDIIYVATVQDQGVYKSEDGGASFELITHIGHNEKNNWPMNYRQHEAVSGFMMLLDPKNSNIVYLDYNKMTTDGGKTWNHYGTKEISKDRYTHTGLAILTEYVTAFDPKIPNRVWMGFSDTGLMRSEDNGATVINAPSYHRGEVNEVAGFRDRLVNTSGSCTSIEVDPEMGTTIYASLSMKNATNRASTGGIVIKSVDGGWNWRAIDASNGLHDGIIRGIAIQPSSPKFNRTVFVSSYGNGVYKSIDDGNSFINTSPLELFDGNTRLMDLKMAPSNDNVLYLAVAGSYGIRPVYFGPDSYPSLRPGMYGGVYKTIDGGENWEKCNENQEIPSVQSIAVNPYNEDEIYVAAWTEDYLVRSSDDQDWKKGGVYKSNDGGISWGLVFESPLTDTQGQGNVASVVVNPIAPEIVYAAVENYGVYRSMDSGATWDIVDKQSMDRRQRRFHSVNINPHNPAEVWVAHFGSSFSKILDGKANNYLKEKFNGKNLLLNESFEEEGQDGFARHWNYDQPPVPNGENKVISLSNEVVKEGNQSVNFRLTQAYTDMPSPYQADNVQRAMEKEGTIAVDSAWHKELENTGETRSWICQEIDPYFASLARGKKVRIEMDVFIEESNPKNWWMRGSESGEIPREAPQMYLTEVRDFNVHWVVAETNLSSLNVSEETRKGKWLHLSSVGTVSSESLNMRVTITGVNMYSGSMNLYIDQVKLTLVE